MKILAVTGIRSEYDILFPVLNELENNKNFELKVVVTGAHLSYTHGLTINKIIEDGFNIADRIDYLLMTNRKTQRSKGVGILIEGLTQTVEREDPNMLIFVGDREESIATCIVGNYMNVLVAHIGGGDPVYGNADDPIRLSCSKLAHIHFATAKEYANNLKKIGEEKFRILNSGNPALNNIIKTKKISAKKLSNFLNIDIYNSQYIVVLQHPISSEVEDTNTQIQSTMEAVKEFSDINKIKVIGIYPNSDPGSYEIIDKINEYKSDDIKFYKNLPREIFVNVMRNTLALVGNSSMGILEAPLYKLPVINVGNRQKGRLNAGNVVFVEHNKIDIIKALNQACFDRKYRNNIQKLQNPYGDGSAHKKIVKFLEKIDLNNPKWYIKKKLI
ncbi:UDP-N-acetylglucosamine 2-epimerase (hydrolyzing) [Sulfurimonas aquatica]|uniref:UDP-N-acetylglucosamine 2-epimerase (Hydrolyzing) n=1 Tax=Sulfurimonas aquatica TaxID=2672570 RepID=A0A975B2R1_9BACT|nr:UDP-N-acetylglucosamine 2-epimerase [Sulfurimonas aquatica]QSZ43035.1 UDP-N-acetylglucosamine 2-epimerase (hydrolyzing) [Sulfurimonas aquatica]